MILKLSFLSLVFSSYLFAISVFVTKEPIKYEEKIDISKLEQKEFETIPRTCTPLTLEDLENGEFVTTHHINKNSIVCEKSLKSTENNEIFFNFGGLKIVKKGKIIYENEEFIRFKNLDGTIEQIYKDGRQK
ncbi:hypothetical protein [Aliarcobacter cryaerophilus]|uniref:hypothetical protein n=1 Tax=Aliarcobacter cryaerophilus TaxID=28198 RepID=UPI003DA2FAEC